MEHFTLAQPIAHVAVSPRESELIEQRLHGMIAETHVARDLPSQDAIELLMHERGQELYEAADAVVVFGNRDESAMNRLTGAVYALDLARTPGYQPEILLEVAQALLQRLPDRSVADVVHRAGLRSRNERHAYEAPYQFADNARKERAHAHARTELAASIANALAAPLPAERAEQITVVMNRFSNLIFDLPVTGRQAAHAGLTRLAEGFFPTDPESGFAAAIYLLDPIYNGLNGGAAARVAGLVNRHGAMHELHLAAFRAEIDRMQELEHPQPVFEGLCAFVDHINDPEARSACVLLLSEARPAEHTQANFARLVAVAEHTQDEAARAALLTDLADDVPETGEHQNHARLVEAGTTITHPAIALHFFAQLAMRGNVAQARVVSQAVAAHAPIFADLSATELRERIGAVAAGHDLRSERAAECTARLCDLVQRLPNQSQRVAGLLEILAQAPRARRADTFVEIFGRVRAIADDSARLSTLLELTLAQRPGRDDTHITTLRREIALTQNPHAAAHAFGAALSRHEGQFLTRGRLAGLRTIASAILRPDVQAAALSEINRTL